MSKLRLLPVANRLPARGGTTPLAFEQHRAVPCAEVDHRPVGKARRKCGLPVLNGVSSRLAVTPLPPRSMRWIQPIPLIARCLLAPAVWVTRESLPLHDTRIQRHDWQGDPSRSLRIMTKSRVGTTEVVDRTRIQIAGLVDGIGRSKPLDKSPMNNDLYREFIRPDASAAAMLGSRRRRATQAIGQHTILPDHSMRSW